MSVWYAGNADTDDVEQALGYDGVGMILLCRAYLIWL